MKPSRWKLLVILLAFSVALNIGLASLLRAKRPSPQANPTTKEEPKAVPSAPSRPQFSRSRALVDSNNSAGTDFQWSSVESPDYKTYMANLRRVGCPEETIRDLIIADLNKSYQPRMNAVTAQARTTAYWKNDSGRQEQLRILEKELREIDREKRAVIKELLGVDLPAAATPELSRLLRDEVAYGFLSPEKAALVRSLFQRFEEMERDIDQKAGGWPTKEDRAALRVLQARREAELGLVLNPSELEEYKLRSSSTAENVCGKIAGLDLNEDDFRQMYRIRKAYEDATGQLNPGDSEGDQRERLRQQRDEQIKTLLGDQRYADYQRGQDFEYQALTRVGDRYKLPAETVRSAYEINRLAQEQMNQLMSDRSLDSARRKEALAAIRSETEQELKRTLGAQGYDSFRDRTGIFVGGNGDEARMRSVVVSPGGGNVTERRVSIDVTRPVLAQ